MTDAATRARDAEGWDGEEARPRNRLGIVEWMRQLVRESPAGGPALMMVEDMGDVLAIIDRAAADAARLDWLAREEATVEFAGDEAGDYRVRFGPFTLQRMTKAHEVYHDDLREVIDVAMAAANARALADAFPVPEVPNA